MSVYSGSVWDCNPEQMLLANQGQSAEEGTMPAQARRGHSMGLMDVKDALEAL